MDAFTAVGLVSFIVVLAAWVVLPTKIPAKH